MPTVDNKVVQMTFKNEQFERGVRQSLHSLEELKKALDLDKSAESLQNLEKIAESFDISGIADGIEEIANRFTLLGNLGQEAFRRISSFALDEVHKITSAITSMPRAGMDKYEQKNKTVQMIQSALPEKSLEEIEAVLERLNEYTDLTSYDFANMASNMGKFISAGVDMDVAEKVMEGIANEAASAGGEIWQANIAMNNYSQALAAGAVKMQDWRSIQLQNLDTKEFKEEIIETAYELGVLQKVQDKVGMTTKGNIVDYQSFANTLSEGWFNTDVLVKVFEKYADREEGVGKKGFEAAKIAITLKQALDAVKDAMSTGWMTTFGYLFGNLEEAGDLFTRISDALIDFTSIFSEARNELLRGWHDGGEDGISGYQKVVEGLSNTWSVFMGIVEASKEAFKMVFGGIDSSGLIEASKAFADITRKLKDFLGITEKVITKTKKVKKFFDPMEKWTHEIKKDMKGDDVKKLQEQLLQLGDTEVKLDKYGADGIFGPETQAALKAFQKSVGLAQTGIYDEATRNALGEKLFPGEHYTEEIQETHDTIKTYGKGLQLVGKIMRGIFSVGKAALGVISGVLGIAGKIISTFAPVAKGVLYLTAGLGDLITYAFDLVSALISSEGVLSSIDTFLQPIATVLEAIGTFLVNIGTGISQFVLNARKATNWEGLGDLLKLDPEKNKYALALYDIIGKIREAVEKAAPVFENLKTVVSGAFDSVKKWVSGKIAEGLATISEFFTNLWSTISEGDVLATVLSGIGTALQVILGIIGGVGYGIFALAKAFVDGGIALFNFVKDSEIFKSFLSFISEKTKPVREFFQSVWESLTSIAGKIGNFKSFKEIWMAFIDAMANNPISKKFVPVLQRARTVISDLINKIKNFTGSVRKVFELLKQFKDPKKALQFLNMSRDQNQTVKTILTFLSNAWDFLKKIKSFAGGIFDKIGPQVKKIASSIKDAVKNLFGGNGKSVGENLGEGLGNVKNGLTGAFTKLKAWFDNLTKNSPFISSLVEFGKTVKTAIDNFFSADTSGIADLPNKILARLQAFNPVIDWIKDKFGDLKDFIMDPNKLLSHVVGALKGIGEFVINVFKNVNLGTIWDTAKTALGMYIMMTFAKSLKSFGKSFGVLTGAIDEDEKLGFAEKLRSIAISIAIFTAAVAALAFIDAGQAIAGVGVMTALIGVVVGALKLMDKFIKNTKNLGEGMKAIGAAVLNFTLGIVAIIGAIALAAVLINTAGDLSKPLLLVGGIIVALGVVAVLMSKLSKGGKGATAGTAKTILAIAAGVYLVVKAIGKMAGIFKEHIKDDGPVWKGLAMVSGILIVLGAIAVAMSRFGKSGKKDSDASTGIAPTILAICTTIEKVVSAVGQMANLIKQYPNDIGLAYGMIEGILVTVGTIAVLLTAFSKDIDWKVEALTAAPILAMGYFIEKVATAMGDNIQKISGVDPKIIEQFLIGVAEALIALVGVTAIFSKIGIGPLAEAAVGIALIMGALGLGVGLIGIFTSDAIDQMTKAIVLTGWRLETFSDSIVNVNTGRIKTVMGAVTDTIIPTISALVSNANVITQGQTSAEGIWDIGISLENFSDCVDKVDDDTSKRLKSIPGYVQEFINGVNGIAGVDAAKKVLDDLGATIVTYFTNLDSVAGKGTPTDENGEFDISKANEAFGHLADLTLDDETLQKIKSYADSGDNNLTDFKNGIVNLGAALKSYGENVGTLDEDAIGLGNDVLDKAKEIDTYLNPVGDVNFDILSGKRKSIKGFGRDIQALGQSLAKYGDSISGLNPWKLFIAGGVLDAVVDLSEKLPRVGGLLQSFIGEQSLGAFAVNMSDLGSGMANYANAVSGASFTNVAEATSAVEGLAKAQSILQRYGGLQSMVAGTAGLDKLGENLTGLGTSLVAFATDAEGIKNLKDADFDQLNKAMEPIKKLAEAQSILQRVGGVFEDIEGKVDIATLGAGLVEFGNSLNTFKNNMTAFDFDDTQFTRAMNLLSDVVHLQEIIQNGDPKFALKNAGIDLATVFAYFANEITTNTDVTDAIATLSTTIETALRTNAIDPASTWGYDLVNNLATGMTDNISVVENAASAIASAISAYLHFSVPDKGPLMHAGEYMPDFIREHIVGGMLSEQDRVEKATSILASVLHNGFSNAFSTADDTANDFASNLKQSITTGIAGLFSDGIGDPVITPVLDLSNIDSGIADINGRLNGNFVSIGTNLANSVNSLHNGRTSTGSNPVDSSADVIASIREMGDRISGLTSQMAEQMSNLKVVMDSGALVGQIDTKIDQRLGQIVKYNGRRM